MFKLAKWYCDCVAPDGTAFIGYSARLRWGLLPLRYSAAILARPSAPVEQRHAFRGDDRPVIEGHDCAWHCPVLDVDATWRGEAEPIRRTLFSDGQHDVEWTCHFPRATGDVHLASGDRVSGPGYVEELSLTIKPWKLPLELLHWGRFVAGRDALTWIDWRGGPSFSVAFHNGVEYADAIVTNNRVHVRGGDLELTLADPREIRTGPLGATALMVGPAAEWLVPRRIRNTYESKWLSLGTLHRPDGTTVVGWVIHESVWVR